MANTFAGVLAAAVIVSVAHAALPSHWLPFVLVGRNQGWSGRRVVAVAAIAGLGHVTTTGLLGFLVALAGMGLLRAVGHWGQPLMAGVLIVTGSVYLLSAWRGGNGHHQPGQHGLDPHLEGQEHNHDCKQPCAQRPTLSDRAAFWTLFSVLTFSPCEGMIPLFFASARFGWAGLLMLAVGTAGLTVLGIVALVSLAQAGFQRVRLPLSGRGDRVLTAVVLVALGAVTFLWH